MTLRLSSSVFAVVAKSSWLVFCGYRSSTTTNRTYLF